MANPDIIILDDDQEITYKVGDYCYFDSDPSMPYTIKKIEEIIREDKNQVHCKVQSFSRRRDIPNSLQQIADKHVRDLEPELYESQWEKLDDLEKHQLQCREVYMARSTGVDILPISQIRGKCNVTLLSSTDNFIQDYLETENTHFYTLVYDQNQRTVVTDRGDIRIGPNFQCHLPETLSDTERENFVDGRKLDELETLVFDGAQLDTYIKKTKNEEKLIKKVVKNEEGQKSDNIDAEESESNGDGHVKLTRPQNEPDVTVEDDLDRLIVLGKSVGLFARALDATASTVQPILQVSARMASRDSTLQWAMDCMHNSGYDLGQACRLLISKQGPILVRDQLESWSPSEAQLFEDGVDRYGKEFSLVRSEYLPWKTYTSIIEFYYMWKASDRYLSYKKNKYVEIEKKMTQFGLPKTYLTQATANQSEDDIYWKKYGGLKIPQSLQNKVKNKEGTSLRVSTQINTLEAVRKQIEKEKKTEEKRKNSISQEEDNNKSLENSDQTDSNQKSEVAQEKSENVNEDNDQIKEQEVDGSEVTQEVPAEVITAAGDSMDTGEDVPAKKARIE